MITNPNLDLFTVIWGEMVESFTEITLPSLLPDISSFSGIYTIYSDEETTAKLRANPIVCRMEQLIIVKYEPLQNGHNVNANILHQMQKCMATDHYMLVISPDWALGRGSLFNMIELCRERKHNPILYGFPRINEDGYQILRAMFLENKTVTSRQLVRMAMKYAEQKTYTVGVAMENFIINNDTWIVSHNVPTPCIKPDQFIIDTFATNKTLNSGYDHSLPYILIENGYPWHMVDHSDIYFQVERGRHLIGEQVYDHENWKLDKALKGLRFFEGQKQIWRA